MGKKKDNFARGMSVVSLVIAMIAIALPYIQDRIDSQERASIWMRTNSNGFVALPERGSNLKVVQLPWLFTISNTGKVALSLVSYNLTQLEDGGYSHFTGLGGQAQTISNEPLLMPISLQAGESITFKMHIGFRADADVFESLRSLQEQIGPYTLHQAHIEMGKLGRTIYGGSATYIDLGDGFELSIDSDFYKFEPVYNIEFVSGRSNPFFVQTSDTLSKFGGS